MTSRETTRKIGFATQPSSVIVTRLPGAAASIAIVQVPPKFFSCSVTRVTSRCGGWLSSTSTGTSEACVA